MERKTVASARPELKTPSHVLGIQVSMETTKPANTTYHKMRMIRSMLGALDATAVGGGGGSMVAKGSRLESSARMPGRKSRAPTSTKKGSEGSTAE